MEIIISREFIRIPCEYSIYRNTFFEKLPNTPIWETFKSMNFFNYYINECIDGTYAKANLNFFLADYFKTIYIINNVDELICIDSYSTYDYSILYFIERNNGIDSYVTLVYVHNNKNDYLTYEKMMENNYNINYGFKSIEIYNKIINKTHNDYVIDKKNIVITDAILYNLNFMNCLCNAYNTNCKHTLNDILCYIDKIYK